jgi:hypothetical protein
MYSMFLLGLVGLALYGLAGLVTWSQAQQLAQGAAFQTSLATTKIHLYNAAIALTPATPLATFTAAETTFTGYTAATITAALAPFLNPAGGATVAVPGNTFVCSGTGDTIYGWYLTDMAGTVLIAAGNFLTPYAIAGPGDGLNLDLLFTLAADQNIETVLNGELQ